MSSSIIAKKYALSLIAVAKEDELKTITTYVEGVVKLFEDDKFVDVIKSPLITREEKTSIIIEGLTEAPEKFVNFIKILANADRLATLPLIYDELIVMEAAAKNFYTGLIESDTEFSADKVAELKDALMKKLGVSLDLETKKNDYDGIKVEIPEMGLRIDFSQSHIKEQMLAHILKAI